LKRLLRVFFLENPTYAEIWLRGYGKETWAIDQYKKKTNFISQAECSNKQENAIILPPAAN
jgi:hypothetical protein